MGDGDRIDFVPVVLAIFCKIGVRKSFVEDREDGFEMGASGDFGNDTALGLEDVELGDDDV